MWSFYQSSLWRTIQESIYRKPLIEMTIWSTTYWGTVKQTRVLWKEFRWSMIHWCAPTCIDLFDDSFAQSLSRYKRDHARSDLFLQIGVDTQIMPAYTKLSENQLAEVTQKLLFIQRDFLSWYGLRPTIREHMPHATIVLSTKSTFEEQKRLCSDSGKRMINKASKSWLTFDTASTSEQWRAFWHMWYTMSYDKGFSVVTQEQFVALMDMLTTTQSWYLFLAKKWSEIVSWSVCLVYNHQLIYLYGATDRSFGHMWAHYRLTAHIAVWAHDAWLSTFDLFGISPPHVWLDHSLAGVTRFKQSFWGESIVYAGSYDLICSPLWYKAFTLWRSLKK